MKKLKMFEYEGNEAKINKIREQLTFTELFQLSEELDIAMETLNKSFEQFIFDRFGFDYYKKDEVIALSLELLTLYN